MVVKQVVVVVENPVLRSSDGGECREGGGRLKRRVTVARYIPSHPAFRVTEGLGVKQMVVVAKKPSLHFERGNHPQDKLDNRCRLRDFSTTTLSDLNKATVAGP